MKESLKHTIMAIVENVLSPEATGLYISSQIVWGDEDFDDCYILSNIKNNTIINYQTYKIKMGITKMVIIPETEDFVIKIPFTGTYGIDENNNFVEDSVSDSNVLEEEIDLYNSLSKVTQSIILPVTFVDFFNDEIPVYIQPKIKETFGEKYEASKDWAWDWINDKSAKKKIANKFRAEINGNLECLFIKQILEEKGINMTKAILKDLRYCDDLHTNNYGYMPNGDLAIFDYGGYDSNQWV